MKKIVICMVLSAITATTFSQEINQTTALTKEDYLRKSRHQKTAAWCLVGGGVVSGSISFIITLKELGGFSIFRSEPDQKKLTGASILAVCGVASILASVPFFIAAGKNKSKAMSISFKNEMMPQLLRNNFSYKAIPSVNIKFSL